MSQEADILLVEDSATDAELIREALRETGIPHRVKLLTDGVAALAYLRKQTLNPHLILLDLNLPKLHGLEVLKALRDDPILRVIPVVILTNSGGQAEVMACYATGANAFVRKRIGFEAFAEMLLSTAQFWLKTATLPQTPASAQPKRSRRPSGSVKPKKKA